jgi:hypothetical protein
MLTTRPDTKFVTSRTAIVVEIPTYRLANVLVHGFGLSREQALGFMHAYGLALLLKTLVANANIP